MKTTLYEQWYKRERHVFNRFEIKLFKLYRIADERNRIKLHFAFPDYFFLKN
jgi:hypothetical protein